MRLDVGRGASGPVIVVTDSGPGIPEADRARVLQRFVRLDDPLHAGQRLGLSLVDAVAKLHGAELMLTDNRPGLKVSLAFPAFHELRAQKAAA